MKSAGDFAPDLLSLEFLFEFQITFGTHIAHLFFGERELLDSIVRLVKPRRRFSPCSGAFRRSTVTSSSTASKCLCADMGSFASCSEAARRACSGSIFLTHRAPGIERCLLASASIRFASIAKSSPPTRTLEHAPQDSAVAKPLVACAGERRMIRNLVL